MKDACTITELYRRIGKTFRSMGADQVVLFSSRNSPDSSCEMILEIAVDGSVKAESLQEKCRELWPHIEIKITCPGEDSDIFFEEEMMLDGIRL